ncbi:hypothetical protein [Opitutus terrae]|nr:hypothetical protein [Opitutus terrae]
MRPAAYRYRLHADLPFKFDCGGAQWHVQKRSVGQAAHECELIGPSRYTVTTARDEKSFWSQLREKGVELLPNSYACTLFLHLEQLGLAERVDEITADAA